jgi:hypothetical protein
MCMHGRLCCLHRCLRSSEAILGFAQLAVRCCAHRGADESDAGGGIAYRRARVHSERGHAWRQQEVNSEVLQADYKQAVQVCL